MSDEDADIAFDAAADAEGAQALVLALDVFEGPLHLLLELARAKKVDLAAVSVAEIADQYIAFIDEARARDIEVAGDYLVMAAWLALLKSRLLLPKAERPQDEPDPDKVASALKLKLLRLQRARAAAKRLDEMAQLGRDVFLMGMPQQTTLTTTTKWNATLYDLMQAYCAERVKSIRKRAYRTTVRRAYPLETARKRLEAFLGELEEWAALQDVSPPAEHGPDAPPASSYVASTFGAALELAREGKMELRQAEPFAPLYVRARPDHEERP